MYEKENIEKPKYYTEHIIKNWTDNIKSGKSSKEFNLNILEFLRQFDENRDFKEKLRSKLCKEFNKLEKLEYFESEAKDIILILISDSI
ncbi:MAG: hypothetical protein KAT28_00250 [Candidatus Aenigmarchaeota archaeon]|nr:hypothetical protein [Candidatus Aenigmarchaeota archaeon]